MIVQNASIKKKFFNAQDFFYSGFSEIKVKIIHTGKVPECLLTCQRQGFLTSCYSAQHKGLFESTN